MSDNHEINAVPDKTKSRLKDRQHTDYQAYMQQMVDWLLNIGKNPDKAQGYSNYTVKTAVYQIDKFHRFIWDQVEDGYTLQITTDHADQFMQHIAVKDWQQSYKASLQKSVKREMKYRKHRRGTQEWDPEISYYESGSTHQPRDFLSKQERIQIREAALNRLEAMNLIAGTVFDCNVSYLVEEMLDHNVVFEFDGLSHDV
jgi:hypothetical protein